MSAAPVATRRCAVRPEFRPYGRGAQRLGPLAGRRVATWRRRPRGGTRRGGAAEGAGAEGWASLDSSFLLQPTRSQRLRRQSKPNIATDVFLFIMSPFREVLEAFSSGLLLSRKLARMRGQELPLQSPEQQHYKTLYSTANLPRLPGGKAFQPAWTSPAPDLRRCFYPSTLPRVSALPESVGRCNRPAASTGLLHSPGMTAELGRRTPSDRSRAETIPKAWKCRG